MGWKSDQYRRTGRLDRFSQPWIVELLDSLLETRTSGLTGALSVLYADEAPVAAHFGLQSNSIMAYWFPAYDNRLGKYSPGLLHTLRFVEESAATGVQLIDLGKGAKRYKETLKSRDLFVAEGIVTRPSVTAVAHWARKAPQAWVIRQIRAHPPLFHAADALLRRGAQVRNSLPSRTAALHDPPAGKLIMTVAPNRSKLNYRMAFAIRHPDQVVPFVRRVCVDAWLRARSRDHVDYYRAVMRHKAARSLDLAVGSRSSEQGAEFGQLQLSYLVKHGLQRTDRMLEIGCGNLRAGRFFIGYLEAGNYCGTDISPEILLSAQQVLVEDQLEDKVPRLAFTNDLTLAFLPRGTSTWCMRIACSPTARSKSSRNVSPMWAASWFPEQSSISLSTALTMTGTRCIMKTSITGLKRSSRSRPSTSSPRG